ncbi:hypothetical protein [Rhizobium leguminosarum]|nr:hypothetical protein [Rhizobium leguminosarum]
MQDALDWGVEMQGYDRNAFRRLIEEHYDAPRRFDLYTCHGFVFEALD